MAIFVPQGPTGLRLSVYLPNGTILILDASADLGNGPITYEDTPSGCGSASIPLCLLYEQVVADGYYTARNILEISSGDDCVQADTAYGATQIYVGSKTGYDQSVGHDQGLIAIWDGATLCMRIPVLGVGTDAGGDFITVGSPLPGQGNPSTIPPFSAGSIIYRRRYAGVIMGRKLLSQMEPLTVVTCTGLSTRFAETTATFALNSGTIDMGSAIYSLLNDFATNWPELTIATGNFVLTGQTSFDGSYQSTQISRILADLISAANSAGNTWVVRVGHDRVPRLIGLYEQTGNVYAYNVTLQQGVSYFEARIFINSDQDASQLYNTVEIIGDTDPTTQLPVDAIVQDALSLSYYGEIDSQPITNTACKTTAQAAMYGQSLLNQWAAPASNCEVTVATRNYVYVPGAPMGLSRGDVVLGVHNVTVTEISPAPDVYGLVSSVVTTVEPAGDTYQYARFSAIEPDWSDDVAERANALASAMRQNTNTPVSLDQYIVNTSAFSWTVTGLTVMLNSPFGAIFALGSLPVECGDTPLTLPPGTTTWVWITPSGGWNSQSAPTAQPGQILWVIFTTNATTVIGSINKAATGLIEIPVSALPSMGDQGSPKLSNVSAITYPVVGNGTYDAQASFTVDVIQADWLVGLALFALPQGSTADPHFYPKGTLSSYGIIAGNWVCIWKSIGAGNTEDLYVAYEDAQGRFSGAVLVGTTIPNPAGTTAFGSIGTTAPNPIQPASAFGYINQGGGTYDADSIISLDSNGTTANNALAEIEVVVAPAGRALASNAATGWTPVGSPVAKNAVGVYDITAGGMGVQVSYSVGVRYVGHDGNRSYVYIIGNTTAAQMAQLPFVGAVIDPNTGYIIFTDSAVHLTGIEYQLIQAGIGSMLSASWSAAAPSGSSVSILLNYVSGTYYQAAWQATDNHCVIYKVINSVPTVASGGIYLALLSTQFNDFEFIASMTTVGEVDLTFIVNGQVAAKYSDTTAPLTLGYIGAVFNASAATPAYIDDKTLAIDLGGSPSSTGFKAQANIIPSSLPGCDVQVTSPTYSGIGLHGLLIVVDEWQISFADGSTIEWPGSTPVHISGGTANGIWYFSVGLELATLTVITSLSQTVPSNVVLAQFYQDGVVALIFNESFNVTAGTVQSYAVGNQFHKI